MMRPPFGSIDAGGLSVVGSRSMLAVLWNLDAFDYLYAGAGANDTVFLSSVQANYNAGITDTAAQPYSPPRFTGPIVLNHVGIKQHNLPLETSLARPLL